MNSVQARKRKAHGKIAISIYLYYKKNDLSEWMNDKKRIKIKNERMEMVGEGNWRKSLDCCAFHCNFV